MCTANQAVSPLTYPYMCLINTMEQSHRHTNTQTEYVGPLSFPRKWPNLKIIITVYVCHRE